MTTHYRYAWEKLHNAVHTLVASALPLQDRLIAALTHSVSILEEDHLPPNLRHEFRELTSSVTRIEARGSEGHIAATVRSLPEEELSNLAGRILSLFCQLPSN